MVRYTAQSTFILRQVVVCVTSVAVSTFGCLLDEQSIADNKNLTCFVHATLTMLVAMISNRDVSPGFLTITFLPALAFSFVCRYFHAFRSDRTLQSRGTDLLRDVSRPVVLGPSF